jgi:hypothetical protein
MFSKWNMVPRGQMEFGTGPQTLGDFLMENIDHGL